MAELTKEWLLKTITELEEERDATPGAVNEDAAMALAAMKIALGALEAEHAGFIVKHKVTGKFGSWLHSKADWFRSDEYEVLSAYTAPPAPVSDSLLSELLGIAKRAADEADECAHAEFSDDAMKHSAAIADWERRAAMLQGAVGNSPVIQDGWRLVPEEPTHEMLEAGDEQFGTYDVYRRMIAASPQQK
ncbi:TPA: hypothetical protein ACJFSB_000693 [Escherichia coli]